MQSEMDRKFSEAQMIIRSPRNAQSTETQSAGPASALPYLCDFLEFQSLVSRIAWVEESYCKQIVDTFAPIARSD